MPLKEYQTSSFADLKDTLDRLNAVEDEIFIFFSCTLENHGDPTTKTCYEADDILMEYIDFIRESKRSLHLIIHRTQLEDYFKHESEVYKDNLLRVANVPTLIKWKGYQRLVGMQCCKFPLLSMVFEQECQKKFPIYKPCTYFTIKTEEPATDDQTDEPPNEEPPAEGDQNQSGGPESKTELPAVGPNTKPKPEKSG